MKNKNTLVWVGLGTALVVGATLFFLVRGNKNKLSRKQWLDAGSPGTLEEWSKLSNAQKEQLLASINQPINEVSKGEKTKLDLKIDTKKVGDAIIDLFKPVKKSTVKTGDPNLDAQLEKQTELLEQYRQNQRKQSISKSLQTLQRQYGPGINVMK